MQWKKDADTVELQTRPLQCKAVTLGDGTTVRLTLSNAAPTPVSLLRWGTPWDHHTDPFRIVGPGGKARYYGTIGHRMGNPSGNDYLLIPPRSSVSIEYALTHSYILSGGETYEISVSHSWSALVDGRAFGFDSSCGVGTVRPPLNNRTVIRSTGEELYADANTCSAQSQRLIRDADRVARGAALLSDDYLFGDTASYQTWFGDWAASSQLIGLPNHTIVRAYAHDYPAEYPVKCCDAVPPAYCYDSDCCNETSLYGCTVHPPLNGADYVVVCTPYWGMPMMSTMVASRAGGLIHEHSHIDDNGKGTDDLAYGYSQSQALAAKAACHEVNSPSLCTAMYNADNYQFFEMEVLANTAAVTATYLLR